MRTIFLDYDARRSPKSKLFCVKCQKDLDPSRPYRTIRMDKDYNVLHPDHYDSDTTTPGFEMHAIGMDCAEQLGLEWSLPWYAL